MTKHPTIMGILNVTPDSFSDGGAFFSEQTAVGHALQMIADGADIIDIGGESTRPGSEPISEDEELRRVIPIIKGIRKSSNVTISIDTMKSRVAALAIEAGANMINDVSAATFDPKILTVAAKAGAPICLMHMRGQPKTMQEGEITYKDLIGEIYDYLKGRVAKAREAGIKKVYVDPGFGFGKTYEHNIELLRRLGELRGIGDGLLIGTSRKRFVGALMGDKPPQERLLGSLATLAVAYQNGADIFRVHDVAESRCFLDAMRGISS